MSTETKVVESDSETLESAVETWGKELQMDKAEEEAAELLAASKHYRRGAIGEDALIDEVADIQIMAEQLSIIFGRGRVEERVNQKMDRLRERIEAETANN
jgi:hypothetical protein